jgi:trk system potassium uptake protein TrkH
MARNLVAATYQPRRVSPIRLNGEAVSDDTLRHIGAYFALYVLVFCGAVLGMAALGVPFMSAVSGVAATLNGVGPGMEHLGAAEDFHLLPAAGKLLLSGCMLLGRLEFLSILAMLSPAFWRSS